MATLDEDFPINMPHLQGTQRRLRGRCLWPYYGHIGTGAASQSKAYNDKKKLWFHLNYVM